ncbi:hypothetical protein [Halochromatium sp.]
MPEFQRIVGRRRQRPVGELRPPTREERAWVSAMASRRSRVPKGVFRSRTMEEANADWERWHVELVAEIAEEPKDDV